MNYYLLLATMLGLSAIASAYTQTPAESCSERGGTLQTKTWTENLRYQSGEVKEWERSAVVCVCKDGLRVNTSSYAPEYCPGYDTLKAADESRLYHYDTQAFLDYDTLHSNKAISYEKIKQHIIKNKIQTIDGLMESFGKNADFTRLTRLYSVMMTSQSTQPGKRIIQHADRVFLGISAEPKNYRHKQVEVIEFDLEKSDFIFRVIDFNQEKPRFVDDAVAYRNSPEGKRDSTIARCTNCHGAQPRPLWNSYKFWPNAIEHEDAIPFNEGRFRYLSANPYFLNVATGKSMAVLNYKRMVAKAKKLQAFEKFKYALLGTTVPCMDVESFFPEEQKQVMVSKAGMTLEQLKADTEKVTTQEFERKKQRTVDTGYYVNPNNNDGHWSNILVVAEARYVIEGHWGSMQDWSTGGGPGGTAYGFRNNGGRYDFEGMKFELLKEVEKTYPEISDYRFHPGMFPRSNDYTQRVCSLLKNKSLEAYAIK